MEAKPIPILSFTAAELFTGAGLGVGVELGMGGVGMGAESGVGGVQSSFSLSFPFPFEEDGRASILEPADDPSTSTALSAVLVL